MEKRSYLTSRHIALALEFLARSYFMRIFLAVILALLGSMLLDAVSTEGFSDDQIDCGAGACSWFGESLIYWYAAAAILQLVPQRLRSRYIPESFLLLFVPLLTIFAFRNFIIIVPLALLVVQIVVGAADTYLKYRRRGPEQQHHRTD